jgi:signal transduction histidine kinase
LKHNQNSFSFEFTAISFINAIKNKYAFKLEGFDADWNYRNAQNRIATYTNLEPGNYVFRVKASNNDGIWNEEGTSIKIHIASPFWRTGWFYILCFISLFLISYLFYYIRLRQVMKIQDVRNKISRDLHDEIGSALSSISIYSEVVKRLTEDKVPEASNVISNISESSRTAMDNMSDIVWAINPENDKFMHVFERINIFSSQLFEAKNIQSHIDIAPSVNEIKLTAIQRKNIYLIFKEAINNIAKYSRASNCYIVAEIKDKNIQIVIKDDGVGFENTAKSLGGNGMLNMKLRADEINGMLAINSIKNKGTTIELQFHI